MKKEIITKLLKSRVADDIKIGLTLLSENPKEVVETYLSSIADRKSSAVAFREYHIDMLISSTVKEITTSTYYLVWASRSIYVVDLEYVHDRSTWEKI